MKEIYLRHNEAPFMNKKILKAMMMRTFLNRFRKDKPNKNRSAYKKQQIVSVKLLKTAKKNFYNNLDVKGSDIINFSRKQ